MDCSDSATDAVCASTSKASDHEVLAGSLAEEATSGDVDDSPSLEVPLESKTKTYTYEVQHDTELYVYFNLLDNGEPTKHNFRATVKAMKRHSLPTFERQRFTLSAEQRKRFRFFEKN